MPKKRKLPIVAILTIVTLGIYSIYWLYSTRKEIIAINRQPQSIPRVLILFIPLLAMLVLLPVSIILAHLLQEDTASVLLPIMFLVGFAVLFISGIIISVWWFYRYNEAIAAITQESKEFYLVIWVACFLLGVIVVWMMIAQHYLNKLAESEAANSQNGLHSEPSPPQQTSHDQRAGG